MGRKPKYVSELEQEAWFNPFTGKYVQDGLKKLLDDMRRVVDYLVKNDDKIIISKTIVFTKCNIPINGFYERIKRYKEKDGKVVSYAKVINQLLDYNNQLKCLSDPSYYKFYRSLIPADLYVNIIPEDEADTSDAPIGFTLSVVQETETNDEQRTENI